MILLSTSRISSIEKHNMVRYTTQAKFYNNTYVVHCISKYAMKFYLRAISRLLGALLKSPPSNLLTSLTKGGNFCVQKLREEKLNLKNHESNCELQRGHFRFNLLHWSIQSIQYACIHAVIIAALRYSMWFKHIGHNFPAMAGAICLNWSFLRSIWDRFDGRGANSW